MGRSLEESWRQLPNLCNFLHTLRNGALFNMQSGHTQLRHQRTGFEASSALNSLCAPAKIMLTQQDEAVSGMRACRKCRERQRFLVRVSCLNERPLLGKGVSDKRLEICRVLMPRHKNTGIGFDLFQIAHSKMEPAVCVFRIELRPRANMTHGQPRLTDSRVGMPKS